VNKNLISHVSPSEDARTNNYGNGHKVRVASNNSLQHYTRVEWWVSYYSISQG